MVFVRSQRHWDEAHLYSPRHVRPPAPRALARCRQPSSVAMAAASDMMLFEQDVRGSVHFPTGSLKKTWEPPVHEADPAALRAVLRASQQRLVLEGQMDGWVPSGHALACTAPMQVRGTGCVFDQPACACLLQLGSALLCHSALL